MLRTGKPWIGCTLAGAFQGCAICGTRKSALECGVVAGPAPLLTKTEDPFRGSPFRANVVLSTVALTPQGDNP
jgi:hypothetical protein